MVRLPLLVPTMAAVVQLVESPRPAPKAIGEAFAAAAEGPSREQGREKDRPIVATMSIHTQENTVRIMTRPLLPPGGVLAVRL